MLTIENKDKIYKQIVVIRDRVTLHPIEYYIEGIYEYPTTYDIHLRSKERQIMDELLVLNRISKNKGNNGFNLYTIVNERDKSIGMDLAPPTIKNQNWLIGAIEDMMSNK